MSIIESIGPLVKAPCPVQDDATTVHLCFACDAPVSAGHAACPPCLADVQHGHTLSECRQRRASAPAACESCGGHHDEADPADWPSWTDTPALELLDPADDAIELTPADWEEYAEQLDAEDRDWWAAQDAESHADEPIPLEVLAASEPFDWYAPNPASEVEV